MTGSPTILFYTSNNLYGALLPTMPLFTISTHHLKAVEQRNFATEKALQNLIEKNLSIVFNCRFVASEFSTGSLHSGRIDTLALSEDDNPVIIEYKKVESSELITQGLYYLSWIRDHRGDFEIAVQKTLGRGTNVDWSDVRVICIAPQYRKFDLYAVQVMGANIELWRYRLFANDTIFFEEVLQKSISEDPSTSSIKDGSKDPKMVLAGKKAAITRATGVYSIEQHFVGKREAVSRIAKAVQEFILTLDPAIEEVPKKNYIAYKNAQNIVCMGLGRQSVWLYLKLDPSAIKPLPKNARDVSTVGHLGTGDLELTLSTIDDFENAKPLIELAYRRIGG